MDPELARQLGDRPIPLDRRQRHLRLERPVVLLACPLHVLLLRYPRFLGAGLHLSLLSQFRGPAHSARIKPFESGMMNKYIFSRSPKTKAEFDEYFSVYKKNWDERFLQMVGDESEKQW